MLFVISIVVLCVGAKIRKIDDLKTRDQELEFIFVEHADKVGLENRIESLDEGRGLMFDPFTQVELRDLSDVQQSVVIRHVSIPSTGQQLINGLIAEIC